MRPAEEEPQEKKPEAATAASTPPATSEPPSTTAAAPATVATPPSTDPPAAEKASTEPAPTKAAEGDTAAAPAPDAPKMVTKTVLVKVKNKDGTITTKKKTVTRPADETATPKKDAPPDADGSGPAKVQQPSAAAQQPKVVQGSVAAQPQTATQVPGPDQPQTKAASPLAADGAKPAAKTGVAAKKAAAGDLAATDAAKAAPGTAVAKPPLKGALKSADGAAKRPEGAAGGPGKGPLKPNGVPPGQKSSPQLRPSPLRQSSAPDALRNKELPPLPPMNAIESGFKPATRLSFGLRSQHPTDAMQRPPSAAGDDPEPKRQSWLKKLFGSRRGEEMRAPPPQPRYNLVLPPQMGQPMRMTGQPQMRAMPMQGMRAMPQGAQYGGQPRPPRAPGSVMGGSGMGIVPPQQMAPVISADPDDVAYQYGYGGPPQARVPMRKPVGTVVGGAGLGVAGGAAMAYDDDGYDDGDAYDGWNDGDDDDLVSYYR
jgi:hypothetical protein